MLKEHKTILLTGASGGIGTAIAKQMNEQGATLMLVGRELDKLNKLKASLGQRHVTIQADIANKVGRECVVEACQKVDHGVDIVINNAGIGQFDLFEQISEEKISQIINVNLSSTLLLTHALLPLLQKKGEAQIINIGSTFGSIGFPGFSVYSASKFAIRGFSEALRRELKGSNICVQYFAPRATKTPINNVYIDAMNKELGSAVDKPEEVAKQLLSFMQTHNRQYFVGWPEKLLVRINGLLPGLVESSIVKKLPRIKHYLAAANNNQQ
mgnify:CR=1 FL=1